MGGDGGDEGVDVGGHAGCGWTVGIVGGGGVGELVVEDGVREGVWCGESVVVALDKEAADGVSAAGDVDGVGMGAGWGTGAG